MSDSRSIEIDFDVHKRIETERRSFSETPNAVLRRLLQLENVAAPANRTDSGGRHWFSDGVTLQHGTDLRMKYNGRLHTGKIDDGDWLVEGSRYNSPSAAAGGAARTKDGNKTNLDGWAYWDVKRPGELNWMPIRDLRWKRPGD